MKAWVRLVAFLLLWVLDPFYLYGQVLKGRITDDSGKPIPYASIYAKELRQGTSSNSDGDYMLRVPRGQHSFVFRSLGYETVESRINVDSGEVNLNITMPVKPFLIAPVTVGGKGEDIAYDVVRKAIAMAPYYRNLVSEYEAEVYLKGTFKVDKFSWLVKRSLKDSPNPPREGTLYMQETYNNVRFTAPDKFDQKVKMVRSNFPGEINSTDNILGFVSANLYQPKIGEIILPLAPYAFNHYRFKYEGYAFQDSRALVKVKVIPKRKSRQLVEGYMYIAEDYWNLHEIDFTVQSLAGPFRIKQTFGEVERNAWLPISQYFDIDANFLGNIGRIQYVTAIKYLNVKLNSKVKPPVKIDIVKAVENKQIAEDTQTKRNTSPQKQKEDARMEQLWAKDNLTNREMYELQKLMQKQVRQSDSLSKNLEVPNPLTITVDSAATKPDTLEWQRVRPIALNAEEFKVNKEIDSKLHFYSDSVTKVNLPKILYNGYRRYDAKKKRTIRFSGFGAPNELRFNTVDGFVVGAWGSYGKQYQANGIYIRQSAYYAFARKTPMGETDFRFSYANMNRGLASVRLGWISYDFNGDAGIGPIINSTATLWFGRNYKKLYENRYVSFSNRIDPFNGFEVYTSVSLSRRVELQNNTDFIIYQQNLKWYTPNIPANEAITTQSLSTHNSLEGSIRLRYTPFYYYRIRNGRKQMLYSRWPTITFQVHKALPNVLNSNSDYLRWEAMLNQTIRTGPSNRITYKVIFGDFAYKHSLYFVDFKHFNTMRIPVVIPSFNEGYQNISYYRRSTSDSYAQAFLGYQSPYLALKYLPFLSNRIWLENLQFAYLKTQGYKPYYEVGYYISQIGVVGGVGIFGSFEGTRFHSLSVKVSLLIPDFG
ncbi:MAG TPA: carboxypeptidase-like regulatory domain-containing protein [Bacteroidales bacterium]|nr:carboxypeptidase-like regulatory domain-containing protein [Bacteroidales bacterium]